MCDIVIFLVVAVRSSLVLDASVSATTRGLVLEIDLKIRSGKSVLADPRTHTPRLVHVNRCVYTIIYIFYRVVYVYMIFSSLQRTRCRILDFSAIRWVQLIVYRTRRFNNCAKITQTLNSCANTSHKLNRKSI